MKRLLLTKTLKPLLLALLLSAAGLTDAQNLTSGNRDTQTITRGGGGSYELTVYPDATITDDKVPMYVYYFDDFSRSQHIIPASELTAMSGGTITAIKYYTTSFNIPYTTLSEVDIYLKEGSGTTLSSFVDKSTAQIVYHGTVNFVAAGSQGEVTITFTTPFAYNGGDLLVGCDNTTDAGYKQIYFYGDPNHTGAALYGSDSESLANVTPNPSSFLPRTTFTYTEGQEFTVDDLIYSVNEDGVSVTVVSHVDNDNATGPLTIPETVTYSGHTYTVTAIGDSAFENCDGLTGSLTIPNSVTTIGNRAFFYCDGFTGSLTLGNSVTTIEERAFTHCTGFTGSLTIPNSVTTIGESAFMECSGLTGALTLGNSVATIEGSAFSYCDGFTGSLVIPNSVTAIGSYAFYGCSSFSGNLTIGNAVTTIGESAFEECDGFTGTLTLGSSVTTIGESAFYDCSGFTGNLTIPNSVTTIGEMAFDYCSGFSGNLIISNSVTTIEDYAFEECSGFTSIEVLATTPPTLGQDVFYGISNTIPVTVPCGTLSAYTGWGGFNNIAEYCPQTLTVYPDATATDNKVPMYVYYFDDFSRSQHIIPASELTAMSGGTITAIKYYTTLSNIPYTTLSEVDIYLKEGSGTTLSSFVDKSTAQIVYHGTVNFVAAGSQGEVTITFTTPFAYNGGDLLVGCDNTTDANYMQIYFYGDPNHTGAALYGSDSESLANVTPNPSSFLPKTTFTYTEAEAVQEFTVGDLIYSVNEDGVSVTVVSHVDNDNATGPLTIPETVTYSGHTYTVTAIGDSAFENCDGLTGSLTIPNSVTTIGNRAFFYCDGFTGTLTLGNSVTTIEERAFTQCTGFTGSLTIPNSVTTIGESAFMECSGFTGALTLGNSLATIEGSAFSYCYGLTGSLVIPNSVTTIGGYAFSGCSSFSGSLTIGNAVTTINDHAFDDCSGFTGMLTLGNSVTTIGESAFEDCSGFTGNLTIPNSVTTIDEMAFSGCSGFSGSLIISNSVTTIEDYAFAGCSGFTSLTIPNSVTTIEGYAFAGCSGFTSLTIPNSVTTIGESAFYGCSGFTGSLTIPNSVTTIGRHAFNGCSGFTGTLTISNAVTTIQEYTFVGCNGFTSLTIPNSVTTIEHGAFEYCSGFSGSLNIPNSVTTIGESAFYGCSGFTGTLTIPNSVTTIGRYAFDNCSGFTSLTIPNSVTTIEYNAFSGCSGLTSLQVLATTPPTLGQDVFSGIINTIPVTVPCGTLSAYTGWGGFSNILEDCGGGDDTQTANFNNGWNWYSTYIELNDINGLQMLENSLSNQGIQIKSQVGYTNYYEGMGWMGTLTSINNESSYKIKTNGACTVSMTGEQTTSAAHPITIKHGWNWIGYPVSNSMSVTSALSGITPAEGDQLKAQNGYATYYNGMGWVGTLMTINPGTGLLYNSNSSNNFTLSYPAAKSEVFAENITADNNHWVPDMHAYPDNMTVTAVVELDDEELQSENYELAAFANGVCRGSAKLMYVEPLNRYVAFLTIAGDEASELHFGLYDAETDNEETCHGASLHYETNAIIGNLNEPCVIRFRSTTGVEEYCNRMHIYPNPVNRGEVLTLTLPAVETLRATSVQVEIVNVFGVVVETLRATAVQTIAAPNVAGVYTLRITVEGKGTYCRKLVVR